MNRLLFAPKQIANYQRKKAANLPDGCCSQPVKSVGVELKIPWLEALKEENCKGGRQRSAIRPKEEGYRSSAMRNAALRFANSNDVANRKGFDCELCGRDPFYAFRH